MPGRARADSRYWRSVRAAEIKIVNFYLDAADGDIQRAADAMEMDRAWLYRKLRMLDIPIPKPQGNKKRKRAKTSPRKAAPPSPPPAPEPQQTPQTPQTPQDDEPTSPMRQAVRDYYAANRPPEGDSL